MEYLDIRPRIFKTSDLLTWWRERSLDLSPFFQRRPGFGSPVRSRSSSTQSFAAFRCRY